MTTLSRTSLVWLWIAALLTATVGVSVQRIYCYCVGETTIGLFVADDACQMSRHSTVAKGCCSAKKHSAPAPSCCQKGADQAECDERGCTHKTTQVFQWKADFLIDKPFEKNFDLPAWSADLPFFRKFLRTRLCEADVKRCRPPPAPLPPLSGRMICVRHQIFRL